MLHCVVQDKFWLQLITGMVRCRQEALKGLGFEFDEARAEWMRWYAALTASTDDIMIGSGLSRDLYLYYW